jgi:hypothetical protein
MNEVTQINFNCFLVRTACRWAWFLGVEAVPPPLVERSSTLACENQYLRAGAAGKQQQQH